MAGHAPDFAAAGLLDGLEGEPLAARERLLALLHEMGVGVEEMRRAAAENRLALLAAERELTGSERFTPREVAAQAGVDLGFLDAQRRASGLPHVGSDEPGLTVHDLAAAKVLGLLVSAGMPTEGMRSSARAFGESAARAAAAVRTITADALTEPGDTEHDVALRLLAAAKVMSEPVAELLAATFRLHLAEQIRGDVAAVDTISEGRIGGSAPVAVAFADLVGFTRLGQGISDEELSDLAGRLGTLAEESCTGATRVVKTIGDAVMLVSPEPREMLLTLLGLLDAAGREGEEFPQLRAGAAFGPATFRWGDWYGTTVNVASRVCARSRPGSVLATSELKEAAGDDGLRWSFAGEHHLKGIRGELALHRCRAAEPGR